MRPIADRLDDALAGLISPDDEVRPLIQALEALAPLRPVARRSPADEDAGLRVFLSEARALRSPAVSAGPRARLTGWKWTILRKELSPMNVILTLALLASLAFGGAGATTYAAQASLPGEPLYGLKLASEDLRLGLAADPEDQVGLLLVMAQTRTQEMVRLAEAGQPIPEPVAVRLQTHLATTLHLAAGAGDEQLFRLLEQVRDAAQVQRRTIDRLQSNAPADAGLGLAKRALTQTQELAQLGLTDPGQFRNRLRNGANETQPDAGPVPESTPQFDQNRNRFGEGEPGGQAPNPEATPLYDQNRYGPNGSSPVVSSTNTPGAGDPSQGPGPMDDPPAEASCTPEPSGHSYGPGPANPSITPSSPGNSYGPGPNAAATTTPEPGGNSYGPGPMDDPPAEATCTPEQDGNTYGPGPGNPAVTPSGDNNSLGSGPGPAPSPVPGSGQTPQPGGSGGGDAGGGRP